MKKLGLKIRTCVLFYLKWAWPILLADIVLEAWAGGPATVWRSLINSAAFIWILCSPVAPLTFLFDRELREHAMARVCGLRQDDERERAVTGEAARAALLFGLSLQIMLLVMTLVSVRLSWDPNVPKGERHGLLSVGLGFSSAQHLDPFGASLEKQKATISLGSYEPKPSEIPIAGGFLLAPSTFSVLLLIILIEVAAFKIFAVRKYEGVDA